MKNNLILSSIIALSAVISTNAMASTPVDVRFVENGTSIKISDDADGEYTTP